ncbi:MAG: TrkH family potassium uptake protein [Candidatus Omnitrophica bacterium]|nr:TrkH family potassium uptake protein [Candidatus Omnitrophota bacterium]
MKTNTVNKFLDASIIIAAAVSFVVLLAQWGMMPIIKTLDTSVLDIVDIVVFAVFCICVLARFIANPFKKGHLKEYWIDLIVILPIIQIFQGVHSAGLAIVLREAIRLLRFLSRTKVSERLISLLGIKPAQLLIVTFLMTILVGTFLLTLPIATQSGQGLNFVDALFTATSATCVTGLIVQDTSSFFSIFGQLVILLLIQVGALGIMTFSVTLFLAAGKHMSNKEAIAMQDVLDQDSIAGIRGLITFIAKMTICIEVLGVVFLFAGFTPYISDPWQRAYISLFHSVSAFCNAGFSLFPDSLMRYANDRVINLTIALLIIFGGLGFIVVKDIWDMFVLGVRPKSLGLRLHTKLALSMTAFLLVAGTICIFFAENNANFTGMALKDKILISFFQSASARTAGFNSVDIAGMTNASIFSIIILMFIGASSGSTGGGIKTTTFWVLLKSFSSSLQNKDDINAFKRKIPEQIVGKAIAIFILSLGFVIMFMYLLSIFESLPFRDLLFEVVSAFGTVGLSTGITAQFHNAGKLLITCLMFLGRLGPLTIVLAFSGYKRKINYTYAQEKIMVG